MGAEWVQDLRVVDLKEELKKRDLPVAGKKADLVARLTEAVLAEGSEEKEEGAKDVAAEQPEEVNAADEAAVEKPGSTEAEQQPAQPEEEAETTKGEGKDEEKAEDAGDNDGPSPAAEDSKPAEAATEASEKAATPSEAPPAAEAEKAAPEEATEAETQAAAKPGDEEKAAEPEAAPKGEAKEEAKQGDEPKGLEERLPSMQAALLAARPVAADADADMEEAVDFDADMEEAEIKPKPVQGKETGEKQPREGGETPEEEPDKKRQKQEDGTAAATTGRRKRDPIPIFKPRERNSTGGAGSASKQEPAGSSAKKEPAAKSEPVGSASKPEPATDEKPGKRRVSVFDRIGSQETPEAPAGKGAPPTKTKATRALLVTGFVRPFTIVAANNLFKSYGEVEKMWMPSIRDKAYVIYTSEEAAEAARQAAHGLEWPAGNRTSLRPKFVTVEEAETAISSNGKEAPGGRPGGRNPGISVAAATAQAAGAPLERRRSDKVERKSLDVKNARAAPKAAEPEEKKGALGLDDLFRRTEATPHLYWLPLTEEQIAAKRQRSAKQKA